MGYYLDSLQKKGARAYCEKNQTNSAMWFGDLLRFQKNQHIPQNVNAHLRENSYFLFPEYGIVLIAKPAFPKKISPLRGEISHACGAKGLLHLFFDVGYNRPDGTKWEIILC